MSSDAQPSVLIHATEELLEEYSFGRICEPALGCLEEHLLICAECQSALDAIDEYKIFMRAGLASFERERQAAANGLSLQTELVPAARPMEMRTAFLRHLRMPRMSTIAHVLAAALLFVMIGVVVAWRVQSPVMNAPMATVKLIALRGGEGYVARAPLERSLNLVCDRTDLLADVSYRAEVVNSSGRRMWTGGVQIGDQRLSMRVDRLLPAGEYWVRLYSSREELLREFGLKVG